MASSLARTAESNILHEIKTSLANEARDATFAIGGSVPIRRSTTVEVPSSQVQDAPQDKIPSIGPVQIRFGESGQGMTLTLPTPKDQASNELQELISACSPASFGRDGEEVLDETYRKAGKLDTTAFATTFCPYQAGIIDVVAQVLLPNPFIRRDNRGVRAELYKLNVYSAPSGMFKAHVDTPRSEHQIGSLVVALPVEHKGGELAVRHGKQEVLFDLSTDDSAIKWAAFYSDCEHEVFKVTSGHRITLTYNLYATITTGHLAGASDALDPTRLPLYETLRCALESPGFLPGGKVLGVWLTHEYAHTHHTHNFLPQSLKGADMVLYEVAQELGLKCFLRPLVNSFGDGSDNEAYDDDEDPPMLLGAGFEPLSSDGGYCEDDNDKEEYVRQALGVSEEWRHEKVIWLNSQPRGLDAEQLAFGATYGNEPTMQFSYSWAVMLIKVPRWGDRMGSKGKDSAGSVFDGIASPVSERSESDEEMDGDTVTEESFNITMSE